MKKSLVVGLSYLVVVAWGCLPTLSNRMSMAIASSSNSVVPGSVEQKPYQHKRIEQTPTQSSKGLPKNR